MKQLLCLLWLLSGRLFAAGSFEQDLAAHFKSVSGMTADVTQNKSSPYLFKPLVSHIKLTYTPEKVIWQLLDPVASIATLSGDHLTLEQDGQTQKMSASDTPKMAGIIKILQAILKLDLPVIREKYTLNFADHSLMGDAKTDVKDPSLIKHIEMTFSPDLTPKTMVLKNGDDRTELVFQNVHVTTGAAK